MEGNLARQKVILDRNDFGKWKPETPRQEVVVGDTGGEVKEDNRTQVISLAERRRALEAREVAAQKIAGDEVLGLIQKIEAGDFDRGDVVVNPTVVSPEHDWSAEMPKTTEKRSPAKPGPTPWWRRLLRFGK